MIKRIGYVILVALLLTGCGAKKRRTTHRKGAPAISRTETRENTKVTAEERTEGSNLYPMPEDPGRFEKFPISDTQEYIKTFAEIAQYEMRAFGIPASITLAQGILESGSGRGELTLKTNNHFGIKCHTGWEGEFDFHDDDAKGECFRKYNHPMFSFRDHSLFLTSRSRYAFLFNYRRDDYKKWAHGLKQAGYATDRQYPQKLIALIERYDLHKYDEAVVETSEEPVRQPTTEDTPEPQETLTHTVEKGDTLYAISRKYEVSVDELKRMNRLNDNTISIGQVLHVRVQ
ncbi:LysM peptidoglycan-binding domain-containing protein [Flagellimonas taeanensis]|uniref:Peptidoglycan hydrolase n=1 Tax=Flagellimonas taeanensis TaxID=1005926 RepID=A0A1M6P1U8_9FLAO|nr:MULTISPECIES: glucosaminidase domain-containing protein [Allomuricauda]MDC6384917.1 glucosaminidase domain-containing protein [Muricauda sp. SK9]RIV49102.1 LysM peptidoglycan-binding domain-containing protein [Allomuricauda taeanensis]SFB66269.1 Flagellum-specific peptidoglycan hydrolase FlgJ [Allomuricauda taeanensis]SHK01884.1 Flagellum-specific peptidoglycan hydrolase FlgJ [Allomuricauda taeanensis]